jgi:hypothetical protein
MKFSWPDIGFMQESGILQSEQNLVAASGLEPLTYGL